MKAKRAREPELRLDREVAKRVRALRLAAGMTQTDLARQMGVTFQQIQKYENGSNRLTAGKLILLSRVFGIPAKELLAVPPAEQQPQPALTLQPLAAAQPGGFPSLHREALALMRSFARIEDTRTRKHILALIKHLGGATAEQAGGKEDAA